jgi:hypothetical protein
MCGHACMFRPRDDPQRSRPRWQCGTCGRVASVLLACCPRSEVAPPHAPSLTPLLSQWRRACGRWTRARVRLVWGGQPRAAPRADAPQVTGSPPRRSTGGVRLAEEQSPEGDDVLVAAGERQ